jgi:hypothetical protein
MLDGGGRTTAVIPLGSVVKVSVREAWPTESGNFTPWLAQSENLTLLADILGLGELQDPQTEVSVGTFRIDILARDSEGEAVLVENQFGPTDHNHLGQLLTYLAGQEGNATIVWIAEKFREEHRAAIDWLNTNTTGNYSFFAVEIELWRIDTSPPAPRFNVIASPNEWTKDVRSVTSEATSRELAKRHQIRLSYWASFAEFLAANHSTFNIKRSNKNRLYRFPVGPPGFSIVAMISIQKRQGIVGLSKPRSPEKSIFHLLVSQKDTIETEFGEPLEWEEKRGRKRSFIFVSRKEVNPADQTQYQELHAWMPDRMNRFQAVFTPRIQALPLADGRSTHEDEDDEDAED